MRGISKERLFNIILGLNLMAWGGLGFFNAEEALTAVRLCIVLVQVVVGGLMVFRKAPVLSEQIGWRSFWIPAMLANGMVFKLARPLQDWSLSLEMLFAFGTIITIGSLLSLGASFGIRPAVRSVVKMGPYQVVRHPAYFGEGLMGLACFLSLPSIWSGVAFFGLMLFQGLRILEEEKLLEGQEIYRDYQRQTKWRLVPWVW